MKLRICYGSDQIGEDEIAYHFQETFIPGEFASSPTVQQTFFETGKAKKQSKENPNQKQLFDWSESNG